MRFTPTQTNQRLLHRNPSRINLYIEAERDNTGNVFVNWGDPAQTNTGTRRGVELDAAESYSDRDPCNQDEVWVVADADSQELIFREDFIGEPDVNKDCQCFSCNWRRIWA